MIKLENLEVDTHVSGIEPHAAVKVLYVQQGGPDSVNLTYELLDGQVRKTVLFRSHEAQLSFTSSGRKWLFDAAPDVFKLAAEAKRIQLAHLFDPMMAVHTSDVEPLPHQISACYEAMLPRQPLRYVLADDPGAGKTIMAGLLIRELIMRGDLERCLIVAPGSLVEQWQGELANKFGLDFELLSWAMVEGSIKGNPFVEKQRIIARLDQLARNEDWQQKLLAQDATWDLVIFDEAHKLSAHYGFKGELETTKRFDLAKMIGSPERTRNLLLMTATPHNGKEEDFQAWLALIDEDRFHGKARGKVEPTDVTDIMRRMVKEHLIKFDGTKLFPERRAQTLAYNLSPEEKDLYEAVTDYVRNEMGRADNLGGKKKGMVGFALTVLQRRLASSPHAIAQSIMRRRERLQERLEALRALTPKKPVDDWETLNADDLDDDYTAEELEEIEDKLGADATAAKTIPELEQEIATLKILEKQAIELRKSNVDKKWDELSKILQGTDTEMFLPSGRRRKMIIFTEHKDTLHYLKRKIAGVLGDPHAVISIDGSTPRETRGGEDAPPEKWGRLRIQEEFRQNPKVTVLVATDAAGEGVNLQVANLMVNYDLPWNPNRIEQRFGRIHRIGQDEVCHLWNLVAIETREGEVFKTLFEKLKVEAESLEGKVFDILGQVFENMPLKELLIEAIRYGEKPEVRAQLTQKVEGLFDRKNIDEILKRNALIAEIFSEERLFEVKEAMEKAEARKLQPFFLRRFVMAALTRLNGKLLEREPDRYEIKHVPPKVMKQHAVEGGRKPVLERYERVTFERTKIRVKDKPAADLVHPAHPLMAALLDLTLSETEAALHAGTVLIDPVDPGTTPRLLFMLDHAIREGTATTRLVSRRMQLVEIDASGVARNAGAAPYLNYAAPTSGEKKLISRVLDDEWLKQDLSSLALGWAGTQLVPEHYAEVKTRREAFIKKTLDAVHARLSKEITHWSKRAIELSAQVKAGKQPKMQPENARKRADELKARLDIRTKHLQDQLHISSNPPTIVGCALVLPQGLVDEFHDRKPLPEMDPEVRKRVEMIAMKAVFDAEAKLNNTTKDVSADKCGWDITSITAEKISRHIEVKGRHIDADTVTVTVNEVLEALNQGDKFLLAIVLVDGNKVDGPHYIRQPFSKEPEDTVESINFKLKDLLKMSKAPHLA